MFGEFYSCNSISVAMLIEFSGTFLLMLIILFVARRVECLNKNLALFWMSIWVGIGLSLLIIIFASFTQAGFNPARDFGPRLVAYFSGWDKNAFPDHAGGFFWVYILAPFAGSAIASAIYVLSFDKMRR